MNATQEAKLNMFRATQKHCNDNPTIVSTIPAFQTSAGTLNTTIASIIATAQQEDLSHWRKCSASAGHLCLLNQPDCIGILENQF